MTKTKHHIDNLVKTAFMFLAAITLAIFVSGCEDDSESFDFGANDPNVVVALGDSITEAGYPEILSTMTSHTVINSSAGGVQTGEAVGMAQAALSQYKPGFMLIMFGANDAIMGEDLNAAITSLRAIVRLCKNNQTIPVISTLTPMLGMNIMYYGGTEYLSAHIRTMAAEENCRIADVFAAFNDSEALLEADGLHPNAAGNKVIAKTFRSRIN